MNDLIKVNFDGDKQTTSARELWEFLDKPYTHFTDWFNQYKGYGFIENVDFKPFSEISEKPQGGRPTQDYEITIDMAKELAMLQKSEKGKVARQYFLELEKRWNSPEAVMARALKMADRKLLEYQKKLVELLPKGQAYDQFMSGQNSITMGEVAKALGIGRNTLFTFLKGKGILMKNNVPYQEYMGRGYFEVIFKPVPMGDDVFNKPQTLVTPKGTEYIGKILEREGVIP